MKLKIAIIILIIAAVIYSAGFIYTKRHRVVKDIDYTRKDLISLANTGKMSSADNSFAFDLFKTIADENGFGENIFISPFSISQALHMTLNGASGTTAGSMAKVLGIENVNIADINKSNKKKIGVYGKRSSKYEISVANSLWIDEGIPLKNDFVNDLRQYYKAKPETLDLQTDSAVDRINNWVADKTRNKIKTIIDRSDVDEPAVLILLNAVYFKSKWLNQFKSRNTKDMPFHTDNKNNKTVRMMSRTGAYSYAEHDGAQVISLPYKERFSMYVILPNENSNLNEFCKKFDQSTWKKSIAAMNTKEVHIMLPKFKIECSIQLNDPLTDMGMGEAFDENADFTMMSNMKKLSIDKMLHKAFLDVDEEGSKAAAATAVISEAISVEIIKKEMIVDKPFICAIVDDITGDLLFMGAISDP